MKKEYDLPGQTRETPAENDSLRLFYVSLLAQRPGSEMARRWCAQHGLLSRADAEKWVEEQAAKKGKAPATVSKPTAPTKGKAAAPAKGKTAAPAKAKGGAKGAAAAKGAKKAAPAKKGTKRSAPIEDDWSDDSEAEVIPKPKRRTSGPDALFEG